MYLYLAILTHEMDRQTCANIHVHCIQVSSDAYKNIFSTILFKFIISCIHDEKIEQSIFSNFTSFFKIKTE